MNGQTIGKIGVGSWTFPWATGTILDHRPKQVLDPLGVVQRAKDLGVHVVHFLDNLPLDKWDDDVIRDAHADRLLLRVQQPPRYLITRPQDERVTPRR